MSQVHPCCTRNTTPLLKDSSLRSKSLGIRAFHNFEIDEAVKPLMQSSLTLSQNTYAKPSGKKRKAWKVLHLRTAARVSLLPELTPALQQVEGAFRSLYLVE